MIHGLPYMADHAVAHPFMIRAAEMLRDVHADLVLAENQSLTPAEAASVAMIKADCVHLMGKTDAVSTEIKRREDLAAAARARERVERARVAEARARIAQLAAEQRHKQRMWKRAQRARAKLIQLNVLLTTPPRFLMLKDACRPLTRALALTLAEIQPEHAPLLPENTSEHPDTEMDSSVNPGTEIDDDDSSQHSQTTVRLPGWPSLKRKRSESPTTSTSASSHMP